MFGMKGVQFFHLGKLFLVGCCSLHITHMLQQYYSPHQQPTAESSQVLCIKSLYVERGRARDLGNTPTSQGLLVGADNADCAMQII